MLGGLSEERRRLLRSMFAKAKKGRTWFSIDVAATASALKEPRERLVAALNDLEDQGELTLQVAGLRLGYRFLERPGSAEELARTIHERFQQSETRDVARLGQVIELASLPSCTVRAVLDYFGESLSEDCGHCDRCLGESIPPMPPVREADLTTEEREVVASLLAGGHEALASPRQMARFLCGLASPAASRARLTRDSRFGRLAHLRFAAVMEAAEQVA